MHRMAMAELERALAGLASSSSSSPHASAAAGMVLFKLFVVYREAQRVFMLKDATSRYSEWPYLQVSGVCMLVQRCVLCSMYCAVVWCVHLQAVHLSVCMPVQQLVQKQRSMHCACRRTCWSSWRRACLPAPSWSCTGACCAPTACCSREACGWAQRFLLSGDERRLPPGRLPAPRVTLRPPRLVDCTSKAPPSSASCPPAW